MSNQKKYNITTIAEENTSIKQKKSTLHSKEPQDFVGRTKTHILAFERLNAHIKSTLLELSGTELLTSLHGRNMNSPGKSIYLTQYLGEKSLGTKKAVPRPDQPQKFGSGERNRLRNCIQYHLFAFCELPQESTSFTPFELVYSQNHFHKMPFGLLEVPQTFSI